MVAVVKCQSCILVRGHFGLCTLLLKKALLAYCDVSKQVDCLLEVHLKTRYRVSDTSRRAQNFTVNVCKSFN